MNKPLVALASAASVGLVALAPINANAGCFGCAVGLGILGGVAAGAIVGSAIANSPPPPPPPGAAYPRPPTYAQLAPGCHWGHERVWVDPCGRCGRKYRLPFWAAENNHALDRAAISAVERRTLFAHKAGSPA
jgi:hypothetical protein